MTSRAISEGSEHAEEDGEWPESRDYQLDDDLPGEVLRESSGV